LANLAYFGVEFIRTRDRVASIRSRDSRERSTASIFANQALRDFAIARYLPNGSLDTSFDSDGLLTLDFFGAGDTAKDVAIQPDGRIVVGGLATNGVSVGMGLVRVNP
jgi:hypothetical protein